jgi:hypothetical protein
VTARALIRYAVGLAAGVLAGGRLVEAAHAWREWHELATTDPSAADLYRTDFWVELTIATLIVGVGALAYWLLRPVAAAGETGVGPVREP